MKNGKTVIGKPFEKGDPRINRLGRGAGKQGFAALLKQYGAEDHEKGQTKMERIAELVIDLSVGGEEWAIKCLMDRIDGKPRQVIEFANEEEEIGGLPDDELEAFDEMTSRN